MHLITVAPAPNKLLRELERVTKNRWDRHFRQPFLSEHRLSIDARTETEVLRSPLGKIHLPLECEETLPPFKLFTLMRFRKPA